MFSVTHEVIFWCIFFTALGAFWYNIDRKYCLGFYRWWYRMTHKNPLPEDIVQGFIYNRTTKHKLAAAWLVSTIQSLLVLLYSDFNPLVELLMWLFEVPITLFGFYLGPSAYRMWQGKDDVFETIDKIESGEISLRNEMKNRADVIRQGIEEKTTDAVFTAELYLGLAREKILNILRPILGPKKTAKVKIKAQEDSKKEESDDADDKFKDPEAIIRNYINKK